ncbi:MAG: 30S ribosomal protein S20 [Alphaproteobacteria bacterium MarineAlpha5_Bin11]|nr:30S ribosomal protein S20 [Pelagibacteraceae bacterium]PPR45165.1 MAG: 30S ribosomal protein S20 [Alphaproteobacteria bacterium MarineAlpha5_Bin11]PPR52137.1 MAG: 30S ribosomal protein S20 [Alphaproteobacteria bacterium MarineAlpha5_Bin10]|tara:strand:- start:19863 stop:20123 length:261 start_codon:yes stop_codon:yes gene_type:complete
MPQHKSAKKRSRQSIRKKAIRSNFESKLKSSIKELLQNKDLKDKKKGEDMLQRVNSLIFKAVKRGILKKNKASKKVSSFSRMLRHN